MRSLDPEKVNCRKKSFDLDSIIDMIKSGHIISTGIVPDNRTEIVECGLLALPTTVFFMEDIRSGTLIPFPNRSEKIVATFHSFFGDEFALSGAQYFTEINKQRFSEIPHNLKRRLKRSEWLSVVSFERNDHNAEEMHDIVWRLTR